MIIVTGGAGFIGSNLVKGLNEQGIEDILVVDNLGSSLKFRNLNGLKFKDYLHKEDFLTRLETGRFHGQVIEAIFHNGACSNTMEPDGNYMMANNYEYSKIMLHHALEHRIPFIYASSASVYGDGAQGFREDPGCEEALNVYAYSKLQFDRYVRQVLPAASSQVVGLRYFNVFGPQENHKGRMASVAFHFHNQLLENGVIKLFAGTDGYADGEQRRDFIYVKDVVRVNLHFWRNPQLSGVFNCGTGTAHSFNDVARALIAHYGKGSIEYIPFPEALKGKYQSFTESDASQLRQTGFTAAFTPLAEAAADYAGILDTQGGYL